MRLFFVRSGNYDWINCPQIRQIVEFCIEMEVEKSEIADQVYDSDVLNAIFSELTAH